MDNPLNPARSMDLREIVFEKIRKAIVAGILKPGTKLSEVELAGQLDVSRTPVREAIRQLAQTSLVTLAPRRGAYVSLPTAEDAKALYELRTALEILAVKLCMDSISREKLEAFRRVFSRMDNTTDLEEFLQEDLAFHDFINISSGNRFLCKTLRQLADIISLYRHHTVKSSPEIRPFAEGHIAIIDEILAGNTEKACVEMERHVTLSKNHFDDHFIPESETEN